MGWVDTNIQESIKDEIEIIEEIITKLSCVDHDQIKRILLYCSYFFQNKIKSPLNMENK